VAVVPPTGPRRCSLTPDRDLDPIRQEADPDRAPGEPPHGSAQRGVKGDAADERTPERG
jgi:hypothetical protein